MINSSVGFFAQASLKRQTVDFGTDKVSIRELTAGQRGEIFSLTGSIKNPVETQCRIIMMSVVDEKGELIMSEGDLPKLMAMPSEVVNDLSSKILKLSGLADDPKE